MSKKLDFPVFELLEEYLSNGFYIKKQRGFWWLFNEDGDWFCRGRTIREMLVNLIFTDGISCE